MKKEAILIAIICCMLPATTNAQNWGKLIGNAISNGVNQALELSKYDRSSIRNAIKNNGGCTAATLTVGQGAVVILGSNGYQYSSGVPLGFQNDINQIRNLHKSILDVCITEGGKWSIVTADNYLYGNLPQSVIDALPAIDYPQSLSFNDGGEYATVLSDGTIHTNVQAYQDFYEEHKNDYGKLLSINVYNLGSVWCYENHTTYCGNVPTMVANAINSLTFRPKYVKFNSHGDYVAYKTTNYTYNIANTNERSQANTVANWAKPKQNVSSGNSSGGNNYVPVYDSGMNMNNSQSGICSTCHGSGFVHESGKTQTQCTFCYGRGTCHTCGGDGWTTGYSISEKVRCAVCGQSGRCKHCNGTGSVEKFDANKSVQCRSCGGTGRK